jgi:hypothetical protein
MQKKFTNGKSNKTEKFGKNSQKKIIRDKTGQNMTKYAKM